MLDQGALYRNKHFLQSDMLHCCKHILLGAAADNNFTLIPIKGSLLNLDLDTKLLSQFADVLASRAQYQRYHYAVYIDVAHK